MLAACLAVIKLPIGIKNFQFVENWDLIEGMSFSFGVDGPAMLLIALTCLLTFLCIIFNGDIKESELKRYYSLFFVLQTSVIGFFCSLNLLVLYIFFEVSLIPIFLIIQFWGGREKVYASLKMLLYTIFGSLFMLAAILYLYNQFETLSLQFLPNSVASLSFEERKWLWLAFFLAFAIKIPVFPLHSWLPEAHVQAPTAGSVLLAGILLKLGTFGMLRVNLQLFPEISQHFSVMIFILGVISIFYASLAAIAQNDIKKIIAYSSIAHMGFALIGLFSGARSGVDGAIFQMISHGLISAALFFCIGMIYRQSKTLQLEDYGGLIEKIPKFGGFFLFFCMASIGLPATSGFIGEFLVMLSSAFNSWQRTILLAISVVFSAYYMLNLYKKMLLGAATENSLQVIDLQKSEICILTILGVIVLFFGIFPVIVLKFFNVNYMVL